MHFDYEITAQDYIASQILYRGLHKRRKRIDAALAWILGGVMFIVLPYNERPFTWSSSVLALMGAWWIYCGVAGLFPSLHLKRAYRRSELAGKKFKADVGQDEFSVSGDEYSWRVKWTGVKVKGESEKVFLLSGPAMFIFGKKYLTEDQQRELRTFAGLPSLDR